MEQRDTDPAYHRDPPSDEAVARALHAARITAHRMSRDGRWLLARDAHTLPAAPTPPALMEAR